MAATERRGTRKQRRGQQCGAEWLRAERRSALVVNQRALGF